MNFWQNLKKPILILAPMDGVTDTVFRQIIVSIGKPSVLFTEFVPVDALLSEGKERALMQLRFEKIERPIVAQIWGSKPDNFFKAAQILEKLKFDGIDINMGCPIADIIKHGSCGGLIKNPQLAVEIVNATIKGAGKLPVSVKTRIGFDKIQTKEWVKILLQTDIKALTLHLRTVKEMSKVPAHWDQISEALRVRKELNSNVLIFGNGDVKSLKEAKELSEKYEIDGVMVGRGIFENVWLFNENVDIEKVTSQQKVELLIQHLNLYKKVYGEGKRFEMMKKFVKCYVKSFKGALEEREVLMKSKTLEELIQYSQNLFTKLKTL